MMLDDPRLWHFFNVIQSPRGVLLGRYDWRFVWRNRARRSFPSFRLNLFLQAKRSHFYRRRPRHLRKVMPSTPCWRFDIDESQQDALGKLSNRLGNRAVVAYAAPAFHRLSQLNGHTIRGSVLPNCTFPLAGSLNGHSAWYYTGPGGNGFANADPVRIEGLGLEQNLERLAEIGLSDAEDESASIHLRELAAVVLGTVEEVSDENPRKAWFFERLRQMEPIAKEYDAAIGSARAYLQVVTFARAFNLDWYAIGR